MCSAHWNLFCAALTNHTHIMWHPAENSEITWTKLLAILYRCPSSNKQTKKKERNPQKFIQIHILLRVTKNNAEKQETTPLLAFKDYAYPKKTMFHGTGIWLCFTREVWFRIISSTFNLQAKRKESSYHIKKICLFLSNLVRN